MIFPDDGIDTRIHNIKIKSSKERDLGLNRDLFKPESLVRYPKLEGFEPDVLYRRALLLHRYLEGFENKNFKFTTVKFPKFLAGTIRT